MEKLPKQGLVKNEVQVYVKRAGVEDAEVLTGISVKAYDDDARRFMGKPGGGGPPGYDSIENTIFRILNFHTYKICTKDAIVGGITMVYNGGKHCYVGDVNVLPDYQGLGIGQKALEEVERQFDKVILWTLETPKLCTRNHRFYEKMGYIKVGEAGDLFFYEKSKNAKTGKAVDNTSLENTRYFNVDLSTSRYYHTGMKGACFKDVNLDGAEFFEVNLGSTIITRANLDGLNLRFAQIGGARFHDIGLGDNKQGVDFYHCELTGSRITECGLSGVEIMNCNIDGMKINGIPVMEMMEAYKKMQRNSG